MNKKTKKRKLYHLIQEENVLDSGSKRSVVNMKKVYGKAGMENLKIVDADQLEKIKRKRLKCTQDEEYETARLKDLKTQELEKVKDAFKDRKKRASIILKSYERLLKSK